MVEFLTDFALAAPTVYLLCSLILSTIFSLLFIPSLPLTTINVVVYGPVWGGVISLVGEMLAAYITYYLYQWGWQQSAQRIPRLQGLLRDKQYLHNWSGFWQILFLRLLPFFPSSGATVYALARRITCAPYMYATAIGKIPAIAIEVLGSLGIMWLFADQLNAILIAIFIFVLLMYAIKRLVKWRQKKDSNDD